MSILDRFLGPSEDDRKKEIIEIFERGKNLMQSQFFDRAAVEFSKALVEDKEIASDMINELYQEMQGSNPDAMIALGLNILQNYPDNVDMANLLGNTYRKKGDWDSAKKMYERCLKADSSYTIAAYNLAATVARAEVFDGTAVSSIADFENLNAYVIPENDEGEERLNEIQKAASIYKKKDEVVQKESLQTPEELIEESADKDKSTSNSIEETEETDNHSIDPEASFQYISKDMEEGSNEKNNLIFDLGIFCISHFEAKIACQAFDILLKTNPKNPDFLCFRVLASALAGNLPKHIEAMQKILIQFPTHRYSNINLGYLYQQSGKTMKARTYYFITFNLLEHSSGNYEINPMLIQADTLFEEDKKKKAMEIYEPLIHEIHSPKRLGRIANMLVEKMKLDEATKIYRRMLKFKAAINEASDGLKKIHQKYVLQMDDAYKKRDYESASQILEKTILISKNPKLLERGIDLYNMLKNDIKAHQFKKMHEELMKKITKKMVAKKISLAEESEKKGNYKAAIGYLEQAIRTDPRHEIMVKMSDLCSRINKPELAEKVSDWYHKYLEEQQKKTQQALEEHLEK